MGCDYPIKVNDIQVNVAKIDTKNFQYAKRYHLKCVTIPAYISPKLLTMSVNLTTEATQEITQHIAELNLAFEPTDTVIPSPKQDFLLQKVKTSPSKYRRAYIEVFKFFPGAFIANTLSLVNKEFYGISWDEELWH